EDVDQNALDSRISGDDLECRRYLLLGSAAANVEEVSWLCTVKLDDVHGCHGKACAVDHAADVAIKSDVSEIVLGSFDFLFVFFRQIAQFGNVRMTEQCIAVERYLGIENANATVGH